MVSEEPAACKSENVTDGIQRRKHTRDLTGLQAFLVQMDVLEFNIERYIQIWLSGYLYRNKSFFKMMI